MTLVVRAVFWVIAYLGAVLSPLVFAVIGASQPDHEFWTDFSVALGFVGLAMMGLEFALVARFRPLAAPFGQDALLQFHRQIGYVGLAFILIHFAISAQWRELTLAKALAAPLLVWFGMAALLALVVLIATSVWRRPLRLSYEAWHVAHTLLALVLVVGALMHVLLVDEYVNSLWKQILWGLMSAAFVSLLVWARLLKPRRALGRPWRLERVVPERGETTTLVLKPPAAANFRFEPGQFAWFAIGRSPFSITQHPFSFASSAERDEVELAVKALGDFTSRVSRPRRRPGSPHRDRPGQHRSPRCSLCLIAIARLRSCGPRVALLLIVHTSSESRVDVRGRRLLHSSRSGSLDLGSCATSSGSGAPAVPVRSLAACSGPEEHWLTTGTSSGRVGTTSAEPRLPGAVLPRAFGRGAQQMNARRRAASFRLLAVALMLTGLVATAAVAANNPFAGGHGNVISAGDLRTFSFAVVQHADGTVMGQADVKNRGMNIRLHVEIDCLKFEAGNRAIMSGPITQSSNPAQVAPGRIAVFGVEDNGEGDDAPTDRITTIPDYPAPKSCSEFTFVDASLQEVANPGVTVRNLIPILDGNIQVQP